MVENLSFSKIYSTLTNNLYYPIGNIPMDFTVRQIEDSNQIIGLQIVFTISGKLALFTCYVPINNEPNNMISPSDPLNNSFHEPSDFINNWSHLFSEKQLLSAPSTLAETLLAERMRTLKQGITFYDFHFESNNLLFINDGLLYSCYLDKNNEKTSLQMLNISNAINLKRNPNNWRLLSYIKDQDVFVIDILNKSPVKLTFSGPNVGSGITHYIIQEEFDRINGMWWRPCEYNTNEYHLLIEEFDESEVKKLIIPCYTFEFENEEFRYPQTGQTNAKSNVKLLKIKATSENNDNFDFEVLELPKELFQLFPDFEYLTNAGWTPDGKFIWVQLADRLQNCLSTFLLSFDSFSVANTRRKDEFNGYAVHFHKEVNNKYWVPNYKLGNNDCDVIFDKVNMNTVFLKKNPKEDVDENCYTCSAIFGLSNNGFNHLCFMKKTWTIPSNADTFPVIVPDVFQQQYLTSGDWEVDIHKVWIDETNEILYFLANRDDILANRLYKLNYGEAKNSSNCYSPIQITDEDSFVYMNEQNDWAIVTKSSYNTTVSVILINTKNLNLPEYTLFQILNPFNLICKGLEPVIYPKLLNYDIVDDYQNSIPLYGLLFPPNDTQKQWPTLHYVYGGPSVRLVENAYNKNLYLFAKKMNYFGFAVLVCDGRGSSKRGLDFEGHIKNKIGTVELDDQIFFLQKAAEDTNLIDLDNVGIYGSSYGGYLTLMAILNYSNIYKCGFSASPVVDFKYYDTAYTERYLGMPENNVENYNKASVLTYLPHLPQDKCRLVVAHGGKDENVHFLHTANLIRHSNRLGFNIKFLFYPNSRHGISDRAHLESNLIKFLLKHLSN